MPDDGPDLEPGKSAELRADKPVSDDLKEVPSEETVLSVKKAKTFTGKKIYEGTGIDTAYYKTVFDALLKDKNGKKVPIKFLTEKGTIATSGKKLLVARVCTGMYDVLYDEDFKTAGQTADQAAASQAENINVNLQAELDRINAGIEGRLNTLEATKGTIKRAQKRYTYVSVAKSFMDKKLLSWKTGEPAPTLTVNGLNVEVDTSSGDVIITVKKGAQSQIPSNLGLALFLEASEDEKIHGYMTSKFKEKVKEAEVEFGDKARELINANSIKSIVDNLGAHSKTANEGMKSSRKHVRQFIFMCQAATENARSQDGGMQSLADYVGKIDMDSITRVDQKNLPQNFNFLPGDKDADLLEKIKALVSTVPGSQGSGTTYLQVLKFFASARAHLMGKMSKHSAVSVGVHIQKLVEVRQAFRSATAYAGATSTTLQKLVTFIPVKRRNELMQRYFPTKYARGFVEYRSVGVGVILKILEFFQSEDEGALKSIFKEDGMDLQKAAEMIPLMSRDTLLSRIRKYAKNSTDNAIQAFKTFKMDYRAPNLSYTRNFSSQMESYEAAIKGSVPPPSTCSAAMKDFLTVSMDGKGVPSISRQMVDCLQGLIAGFVVEAVRRANALAAQKSGTRRRSVGSTAAGGDVRSMTVQKPLEGRDVSMALMTMMGSNAVSFQVSMSELEKYVDKQKKKLEQKKKADPAKAQAYEQKKKDVEALWAQYRKDYSLKSKSAPVKGNSKFVENVANFQNTLKAFRRIRSEIKGGACIHEMNISSASGDNDGLYQLQDFMSEMSDAELLAQLYTEKYMGEDQKSTPLKQTINALIKSLNVNGATAAGTDVPYELMNGLIANLSAADLGYVPTEWPWVDHNTPNADNASKRKVGSVRRGIDALPNVLKGKSKISFTGKHFSVPLIKRIAQTTTSTKLSTSGAFCISMGINAMLKLLSNNIADHYTYHSQMASLQKASSYVKQVKTLKHEMLYPKHVYYGLLRTGNHDLYALLKMLHPQFLTSTQDLTYLDEVQDDEWKA